MDSLTRTSSEILHQGDYPLPDAPQGVIDEHDLYPVHEEDSVPVIPRHFWQNNYLAYAIQLQHPHLWVIGDTCLYWEEGNKQLYRAPDVAVIAGSAPDHWPNVYLKWVDPPLLFVAEIGSRSTFVEDTGPKAEIFEQLLEVNEYLYTNRKGRDLRLWRMVDGRYQRTPADSADRVWSEQLGLGFGFDDTDFLRVYTPSGQIIPTYDEAQRALAESQRSLTESQHALMEAERRAQSEAHRREEAEQKIAALVAELERLRGSGAP